MWSPLGSSAMGSSTLRGSLSVNDIPLLLYKNRIGVAPGRILKRRPRERKNSTSSGRSTSGSSSSAAENHEESSADAAGPPPKVPPRTRRNAKQRTQVDTTLTPGADTGAGRLLEKGRCVSMPSVVSTPHTPRHQLLLRHQQYGKTTGSHHRRYLRRFPQVNREEGLVDYYSCALVGDILLQGILYVGERHFAFYCNIFGHKKRLLIPTQDVLKVTKERTAKFIPNAVGIATEKDKFVFASLLSRDATFKALYEVWSRCNDLRRGSEDAEDLEEDDSSPSEVGGSATPAEQTQPDLQDRARKRVRTPSTSKAQDAEESDVAMDSQSQPLESTTKVEGIGYVTRMPRTSLLLIASTLLLVVLFASATVLVYRIALVQKQLHGVAAAASTDFRFYPEASATTRWKSYQELSHRHNKVLSEEVGRLTTRLQEHVRHLHKMRLPLEELAASASKMPDFCTPTSTVNNRGQQQQSPQPTTTHQPQAHPKNSLHEEPNSWGSYAAT